MVREMHACERVRAEVVGAAGVVVVLLVPGAVRWDVLGFLSLLLLPSVEHVFKKLELTRSSGDEEEEGGE